MTFLCIQVMSSIFCKSGKIPSIIVWPFNDDRPFRCDKPRCFSPDSRLGYIIHVCTMAAVVAFSWISSFQDNDLLPLHEKIMFNHYVGRIYVSTITSAHKLLFWYISLRFLVLMIRAKLWPTIASTVSCLYLLLVVELPQRKQSTKAPKLLQFFH